MYPECFDINLKSVKHGRQTPCHTGLVRTAPVSYRSLVHGYSQRRCTAPGDVSHPLIDFLGHRTKSRTRLKPPLFKLVYSSAWRSARGNVSIRQLRRKLALLEVKLQTIHFLCRFRVGNRGLGATHDAAPSCVNHPAHWTPHTSMRARWAGVKLDPKGTTPSIASPGTKPRLCGTAHTLTARNFKGPPRMATPTAAACANNSLPAWDLNKLRAASRS
jgi:hypothetical protein